MRLTINIAMCILWSLTQLLHAEPATSKSLLKIDLLLEKNRIALENLSPRTITVENDPLYHNTRSYAGYPLPEVLKTFGIELTTDVALRFICKDGFKAVLLPGQLDISRAYLVSKAITGKAGLAMAAINEGKVAQDPGPYALVWRGKFVPGTLEAWPHGVVSLESGAISTLLGRAYPTKHPQALAGFELFRSRCMACHSVNMEGGIVGPELNVPKNVTEYWSKEHFFGFVANPQNYRFKSRMAIEPVPEREISAIYEYLTAIASEKICDSLKECLEWENRELHPPGNN
jgi:cytochrome c2